MPESQWRQRATPYDAIPAQTPPHDLAAEAAIVSAVMQDRNALDQVSDSLLPEHFYSEANRRIYEAVLALAASETPVDIVSVSSYLLKTERLQQVGGSAYLAQLVDAVPAVSHVDTYAASVQERWRLRQVIATCKRIEVEAYGPIVDVQKFTDTAEHQLYQLANAGEKSTVHQVDGLVRDLITTITKTAERGERITGISTGFARLDGMTAGLHDGELTIVAARPGMGKSALALDIAMNVAGHRVAKTDQEPKQDTQFGAMVFSLEMPKEQVTSRMVCSEGRIDVGKMRQGFLQDRDWTNLTTAASFIYTLPIWVDDTSGLNVLELRGKVRRKQAEYNVERPDGTFERRVGLVVVDYLQLMRGVGRYQSREGEISDISRSLKRLAKELKVPIVALSQLNRAVETRSSKDKRPQLSDLRESGAIEQDADNVIFIYRDDFYNEDSEFRGIAELIVAKQRNGPTGKVKVKWSGPYTRFDNLAAGVHEGSD